MRILPKVTQHSCATARPASRLDNESRFMNFLYSAFGLRIAADHPLGGTLSVPRRGAPDVRVTLDGSAQ